jgi:hypothetical protein
MVHRANKDAESFYFLVCFAIVTNQIGSGFHLKINEQLYYCGFRWTFQPLQYLRQNIKIEFSKRKKYPQQDFNFAHGKTFCFLCRYTWENEFIMLFIRRKHVSNVSVGKKTTPLLLLLVNSSILEERLIEQYRKQNSIHTNKLLSLSPLEGHNTQSCTKSSFYFADSHLGHDVINVCQ